MPLWAAAAKEINFVWQSCSDAADISCWSRYSFSGFTGCTPALLPQPVPYFWVLAYLSLFSWHLSQLCPPGQTTTLTPTKWPEIPPVWIPVWSYTLLLHQSLRTFTMPSPAASAFPSCSFGNQCWTNKPTPESTLEEAWDHVPQRQMGFAGWVSPDYTSTVTGYLSARGWISRHVSEESTRTQPTPWLSLPEESVHATSLLPVTSCHPPLFCVCSLPTEKAPCWQMIHYDSARVVQEGLGKTNVPVSFWTAAQQEAYMPKLKKNPKKHVFL